MPAESQISVQSQIITLRILWGAFLFAPFLFFALLIVTGAGDPTFVEPQGAQIFLKVLSTMAVFTALACLLAPRILFKSQLSKIEGNRVSMIQVIRAKQISLIIGLALAEAIAIWGFVLAKNYGFLSLYPFFGAVSLVLIVLQFPTENRIRNEAQSILGAHRNIV